MLHRGDQLVAYGSRRPAERIFITVTRAAKDGSWVDIACHTWAVRWTKRITTANILATANKRAWSAADLIEQEADHDAKRREKVQHAQRES